MERGGAYWLAYVSTRAMSLTKPGDVYHSALT